MPVYIAEEPLDCVVRGNRKDIRRFRKTKSSVTKMQEQEDKYVEVKI